MSCEQETLRYLMEHIRAPCLGVMPWVEGANPETLSSYLNVDVLFEN
jgi:dethiobiotin synthetase